MRKHLLNTIAVILTVTLQHMPSFAQKNNNMLTDVIDTNSEIGKAMFRIYSKYGQLSFSGYIQTQYQYASQKGISSFAGGNFAPNSNNRFQLRRGRLRADYAHYNTENKLSTYFVFQFDGTPEGVNIRDFWGRYYENKLELFSATIGLFARPFGYEVQYSSSKREAPERGRMSQILMKTERDMGIMLSMNPRKAGSKYKWLNVDLGIFNGQGLAGPTEYDNHKDIIGRISAKNIDIPAIKGNLSLGISGYLGGINNLSEIRYTSIKQDKEWIMKYDSSSANKNKILPRKYAGADMQLLFPGKWQSELRAEYIFGLQTATANTSATPGTYPLSASGNFQPLYTRNFDGAYFCYLQNIANDKNQLVLKYDWYDPNTKVKGKEVAPDRQFSAADVKYSTIGVGYLHHFNAHLKVVLYYDIVQNEKTAISGFEKDIHDNVLTCRAQFSF